MKYFILTLIIFVAYQPQPAQSRPVSYPTGWTVMLTNDNDSNASHIHYSPTAKYSIGWRHEYLREPSAHIDAVQLNNLLKRWNNKSSQANIYLKSGIGIAQESGEYDPAAFTGVAIDWEDRRYFIAYENRFFWADDIDKFATHKARAGIAPYIGDYGDLHTWLMLQTDYDAGATDSFSVTPLVRLFKGNSLLEAGYNLDNGIQLNFIQRF